MKDRECEQGVWTVVFLTGTLNKEFCFVLTQFKTIVMERIRKPLHYILVVYTRVLYGCSFIDLVPLPLDL